jgi:catechol 2,3-dioxygenase-like lactoylglutathione lyase family enzyme
MEQSLHWVIRVVNLRKALAFYRSVLNMQILRHEEFDDPCDATCNGPYGNKWSKTMIGYGPEQHNFALEIVYNYGVKRYPFGNDMQFIALELPDLSKIQEALKDSEYPFEQKEHYLYIQGPDNRNFKIYKGE